MVNRFTMFELLYLLEGWAWSKDIGNGDETWNCPIIIRFSTFNLLEGWPGWPGWPGWLGWPPKIEEVTKLVKGVAGGTPSTPKQVAILGLVQNNVKLAILSKIIIWQSYRLRLKSSFTLGVDCKRFKPSNSMRSKVIPLWKVKNGAHTHTQHFPTL